MVFGFLLSGLSPVMGYSYFFKHIGSQEGLPHKQVEALAQDKQGYVWIGTRNGLVRYDGYEMRCYYHEHGNDRSLANSFVKKIFTDSRGRVWVCTPEGMSRYNPKTDDFRTYSSERENILSIAETSEGKIVFAGNGLFLFDERGDSLTLLPTPDAGFIVSLTNDAQGNLFFASNTSISRYDRKLTRFTQLDTKYYKDFLTGADGVVPMMVDHAGRLWIGRNGKGVSCIDLGREEVQVYFPSELVRCIDEDDVHNISFGTGNGVFILKADRKTEVLRHDQLHPNLLSDNAVYALLSDEEGNRWVGTYFGGVDIMLNDALNFRWMQPGTEKGYLKGRVLRTMIETEPDMLWVSTEGDGLLKINLKTGESQTFTNIPNLGKNIHSLYYDKEKQILWIGTFRNGLFLYNLKTGATRRYLRERGLDSDAIFYIARQKNGRIWLATTQGLRYYDKATDTFVKTGDVQLDNRFVYTLCVDHNDNVWAGMADVGLYRIDGKSGKITHWKKGQNGLNDNYITCLFEDSRGTMFIGTNVSGLQFIRQRDADQIQTIGKEWRMPHYTICSIVEDEDHCLWVSTNQGLIKIDIKNEHITRYTTDNGLPTNQFNISSSLVGHDGRLYFGTVQGMVSFLASQLKASNRQHKIHWSGNENETLRLTYDEARHFTITYGVIRPATAGIVRYQIRMDGIDQEWRDVGAQHQLSGYQLAPGTYVLHVRANEMGEDWSKCPERQLKIIVSPPWWQSWWARLIYLLIFSAIIWLMWHYYRSRQKSREAIRQAEMENEKIRAIDQAKFEFFTSVSHELKTPLSLVIAPLKNILRQQHLPVDGQRNVEIALKNTKKIEQLVDELVTYNKVETDAFHLYVQQGNPMEFLSRAVQPFREAAREKDIRLALILEDNGEQVWFSPQYVEHIVGNLLSNALKFTPSGGSVTVTGNIDGNDGKDYLNIEVTDTGIGIVKEELSNIFNRYYQTRRGHNSTSAGWGIGLSLVKRLAEGHKGSVSVTSEVNKGSTFRVKLCVSSDAFDEQNRIAGDKVLVPVSDYKLQTCMVDMGQPASHDGQVLGEAEGDDENRVTLLIVEDHQEMLDYLRQQLSAHYRVLTAENGKKAFDVARREMIHLVVSDVMMPEMDGFELCRLLKGSMDTSHIPVILLTAKSESDDVATGYRAGADAYVSKPFDIGILEMQISNILKLVHSRQQEIVTSLTDDLSSETLTAIDRDLLQRMKQLVEENLSNSDFSIADITTSLGISRSLLHVKMKSLMNMSMGDYIRHQRMERACQMLREGNNVSETAYATGFTDPNYFSKIFKKSIGRTPTEYISQSNK